MQIINGQMVNSKAIEELHNYYDKELDCENWIGIDGDEDDGASLTMEIRKSQYDYMVESIHTLKQRYVYASRHADKLKEQNDELKEQIINIHGLVMAHHFSDTWFDHLTKDGKLGAYEEGNNLDWYALPFYSDDIDAMLSMGISMAELNDFAFKKYEEWKNERVQLESSTEAE